MATQRRWVSRLIFLLITLTVCGTGISATVEPTGELQVAVSSLFGEQMDPIKGSNTMKSYQTPFYDPLVGVTDEGKLSPDRGVAYKWESSPDFTKWTFFIRKGIKFHNGDDLTGEDVKFSIERCMSQKSIDPYKPYLQKRIKSVEVINPYEVVIQLTVPDYRFIYFLTPLIGSSGFILPKNLILAKGDEYFSLHPIGSGPYKFVEQVLGSYIKFEAASDKHWRAGVPRFKNLVFRQVPEESTRVGKLRTGEADIIEIGRERQKELADHGFGIFKKEGARVIEVYPCEQWRPDSPFGKEDVRRALNLAINRAELVKYVFLDGGKATGIAPSGSWSLGYPNVKPYDYNPEEAKKLLAKAGYPKGFEIDVYSYPYAGAPEGQVMLEAIVAYWANIGVKGKLIPTDYVAFRKKLVEKSLDGPVVGWAAWPNRLFADDPISQRFHSKGLLTIVNNPTVDELIDKTGAASDPEEYAKSSEETQLYVYNHYLSIPIIELDELFAVSKKVETWNLGKNIYDLNVENIFRQK